MSMTIGGVNVGKFSIETLTVSPSGKNMVMLRNSGHLVCMICSELWCPHIHEIVKDGTDAPFIRKHIGKSAFVSVPLVPTLSVHASVWLVPMPRDEFRAKAYLLSPGNALRECQATGDDIFLGFITSGEGRLVLRRMILAFFEADMGPDMEVPCLSMNHDWGRKAQIATMLRDDGVQRQLIEAWHIKWYKKCSVCFIETSNKPANPFAPDLIPGT